MRQNKGITMISLIVYIIVFTMVIGTVAMITGNFTKNTDQVIISSKAPEQYEKLTTYLVNDMESGKIKSVNVESTLIDITLLSNIHHMYTYSNNNIYYIAINEEKTVEKKIVLCEKVSACSFDKNESKVNISVTINEITYNNAYTIKIAD